MNKKQIKEFLKVVEELEKDYDVDVSNYVDEADLKNLEWDAEEIWRYLWDLKEEWGICDKEVIYYDNAIEYLKENDSSLQESLTIAMEMGFTIDNLNSEILASLLASRKCEEEFDKFVERVIDWLEFEEEH